MEYSKYKPWPNNIWLWISIGLVIVGAAFIYLYYRHTEWSEHFQVIGSVCSVIGLIFAISQIIHARKASEAATDAVQNKLSDLNNYYSYADVSKCEVLIDEIQSIARQKNPLALQIKLKELKDKLIDIKSNPRIIKLNYSADMDKLENTIMIDIMSCSLSKSNAIEYENIIEHAESIKTHLTKIACELKYNKYE